MSLGRVAASRSWTIRRPGSSISCGWTGVYWCFFFSSRRRHTRLVSDWSSDVCSSDLLGTSLSQLVLTGDRETGFVLAGIAIPILKQGLMLAGPLFLYLFRGRFREPLDGLAFGVASGLGFSLATSLADFWPLLGGPLVGNGSPIDWAVRLARAGLLVALVNACTTGLVTAALWLHRYDRRRANRPF